MSTKDCKIADCHCDTVSLMGNKDYNFTVRNSCGHIDLPRLQEGGVGLQFFAVCVAPDKGRNYLQAALEQVARYHHTLASNREQLVGLERISDLNTAVQEKKVAALLALEGAEPIEGSPELLDIFYRLGVRSLSLTWNHRNTYADGAGVGEAGGGLTRSGRELVRVLGRRDIVLDLAHLSTRCFYEALELSARPPLVSHANARQLCDHPRNLDDEQLRALASRDGVIGLSFYPYFVTGEAIAAMEHLLDHFVHIAGLIGVEHIAFGSDFDGIDCTVDGISGASDYDLLLEALGKRGFLPAEIKLIAWGNVKKMLEMNLVGEKS